MRKRGRVPIPPARCGVLTLLLSLMLLTGCAAPASNPAASASDAQSAPAESVSAPQEAPVLWPWTEEPVKVEYDRMWEYSARGESEDPSLLAALTAAVQSLEVEDPSEVYVEDYTDVLTFTFADGEQYRLEFEEQQWVAENGQRYTVEGLKQVRSILDTLLGEDALR